MEKCVCTIDVGKTITVHLFSVNRKLLRNNLPIIVVLKERGKLMRSIILNKKIRSYKYKKKAQTNKP